MSNSPRRFAAFDIDGTIFRWQLYHELFDEFFRRGIISESQARPVFEARAAWQNRSLSFTEYEYTLIDIMEQATIGLSVSEVDEAAESILAARGSHIYRYTVSLLTDLKAKGYITIALSGSHQQLVEQFAALYGIDIVHGRQFAIEDGVFVGKGELVFGRKAELLQSIVAEHDLVWEDSYAIGDTNSDGDMMDLVTHPVAFNPDHTLYERARRNHWPIVVERKDMIYELAADGQTYVLA